MTDERTLVILGATGDLTSRLLLPALAQLLDAEPDTKVRLVGAGMDAETDRAWRSRVKAAFGEGVGAAASAVVKATRYVQCDITATKDLTALLADAGERPVLYFAVPPAVAAAACRALTGVTLPAETILALEKPFGTDQHSAEQLNAVLAQLLPEQQIFRVDHFLGRSMVLNMLGVRFANRVFEPVWSSENVASVTIRYDESLGLEGRAGYYDKAGALEDMIQSHLLQVLAFVAMEPPATLDERDLRDATGAALRATHVWDDNAVHSSRRARYTAGTIDGTALPNYVDEPGVDPSRGTETLAEAVFEVRTARWEGVPFTLRSGKAMSARLAEVVLRFKPVHHLPTGFSGEEQGSVLRFSLGPDVFCLDLNVNGAADPFSLSRATMHAELGEGALKAYAEVLSSILSGDAALAVRGDAAEECWRIVQPVLDAWRRGDVPLDEYPAGSTGPDGWPPLG
ncbi:MULTISPECIES: glucose-6-phosphate dehydrogenase [Microbacterium]|uniref:glucose-6-phosphate dehydrogenase n=2 Tax=Microbacteriaceae TaxID=85023 RepID=UPI0006FE9E23|nr:MULTISPECIES: glucose-6-phosphate dehydrogenase [unclassified Microbacterium]KQS01144.1 glucose-6-phosphate dehydrogenase [Microbacterium sp. Leaf347]MBN9199097.1 glucose-6-phosphate dehydrogenase [Microbacterium ginsengisoli]OJU75065.1 MAG: glucose-6-phosphate dehydrogenase [Microbacterium sp. 71-23]